MHGVLVVDKPVGPTSHDVVATARRALRLRRIGHTGTLDPLASGVLALVVGQATRLAQYFSAEEKEYVATIRFGIETDSFDITGQTVRASGAAPTPAALTIALERFRGAIDQVPPAFSAKKIGGDRAYDLARRAKPVTLSAVPVHVQALDLITFTPPVARLRLVCSAGFYVRSLAHDLGEAVGTGAALEALERRRSGDFTLAAAVPFADVASGSPLSLASRILPMERLLSAWPAVELRPSALGRVAHGQALRLDEDWRGGGVPPADHVRVLSPDGRLVAIAKPARTAGILQPAVVFRYNE